MNPNQKPSGTLAKITNFFRGNQKTTRMAWKQSGEKDGWAEKAVDALVKKLKHQPNGIKNLETALQKRTSDSQCVTIPRSMDGRLQILNCKALPHVIYCRVWRWPDLQNHNELREVKNCQFPFSKGKRSDDVCINPYHYERVENTGMLPPILVPRLSEFYPGHSKLPTQQVPQMVQMQQNIPEALPEPMPNNVTFENNQFTMGITTGQNSPLSAITNQQPTGYQQQQTYSAPLSTCQQSDNYNYGQNQTTIVQVPYEEADHWATVAYYELNNRVGEQFKCNSGNTSLIVDGYTQPSCATSNRFCLGQLSNVSRNSTIESTRRHIGKGVNLYHVNNELYLHCASDSPVFVQSSMTNYLHNFQSNVVCKIMPKHDFKIFDYIEFSKLVNEVVSSGFEQTYGLTKMCTIRISFVKGWGAQYHRQDITSTPCWIEIHLNSPLKWLDNVLVQMGSPLYNITSVS